MFKANFKSPQMAALLPNLAPYAVEKFTRSLLLKLNLREGRVAAPPSWLSRPFSEGCRLQRRGHVDIATKGEQCAARTSALVDWFGP